VQALGIIIFVAFIAWGLWRTWRFHTRDTPRADPANPPDIRNFAPPTHAGDTPGDETERP
jgi:hypothetical protein